MGLFSRRKKQDDAAAPEAPAAEEARETAAAAPEVAETAESAPAVNVDISVQAFRGLGAPAGPTVDAPAAPVADDLGQGSAEEPSDAAAAPQEIPAGRPPLPFAPADPPEQTETIPGMKDNVLLREALAVLEEGASQAELLGVLRQALQGSLFLRVQGDAGALLKEGKPLSIGVVNDGENSFMLAFSSAGAVRDSVQLEDDPSQTSAVVQPVQAVFQQVVDGPFAGLIVDNASAPHRVVFPTELLQKALEEGDPSFAVKELLAAPRDASSEARVADALATARLWVAVHETEDEGFGVAEAHTADGARYLQVFSHPLEVIALGRGDRPLPFSGEQIGKVLATHPEMTGVLVDAAGPTIAVSREALGALIILADAAE